AHALEAAMVERALAAGADVLAHTPVEPLPAELVRLAGARRVHVLSTLKAFGGSPAALDNLRRLRTAGARVAYGTDLGNEGTAPGIDAQELALLAQAGLSSVEVVAAATSAAAELLGEPELGRLTKGAAASVIGVREEALKDLRLLAQPLFVLIDGAPPPAARTCGAWCASGTTGVRASRPSSARPRSGAYRPRPVGSWIPAMSSPGAICTRSLESGRMPRLGRYCNHSSTPE